MAQNVGARSLILILMAVPGFVASALGLLALGGYHDLADDYAKRPQFYMALGIAGPIVTVIALAGYLVLEEMHSSRVA